MLYSCIARPISLYCAKAVERLFLACYYLQEMGGKSISWLFGFVTLKSESPSVSLNFAKLTGSLAKKLLENDFEKHLAHGYLNSANMWEFPYLIINFFL